METRIYYCVQKICCAHDAGLEVFDTLEAAKAYREAYREPTEGHERIGIVKSFTLYGS